MALLKQECGLDPFMFSKSRVKEELVKLETVEVPEQDRWRLPYFCTLMEEKYSAYNLGNEKKYNDVCEVIIALVMN